MTFNIPSTITSSISKLAYKNRYDIDEMTKVVYKRMKPIGFKGRHAKSMIRAGLTHAKQQGGTKGLERQVRAIHMMSKSKPKKYYTGTSGQKAIQYISELKHALGQFDKGRRTISPKIPTSKKLLAAGTLGASALALYALGKSSNKPGQTQQSARPTQLAQTTRLPQGAYGYKRGPMRLSNTELERYYASLPRYRMRTTNYKL